jgi:hypothetical protein
MLPKHFQAKIIARKIERENQPAAILSLAKVRIQPASTL